MNPTVNSVDSEIREVNDVLADTGYFSEKAVLVELEADGQGPTVYCAVENFKRLHKLIGGNLVPASA